MIRNLELPWSMRGVTPPAVVPLAAVNVEDDVPDEES